MSESVAAGLRERLIAQAEEQHADDPSSRGRWDTWRVGRINRDVRLIRRVPFRKGDVVLVSPETFTPNLAIGPGRPLRSCYSPVTQANTSVFAAWVAVA